MAERPPLSNLGPMSEPWGRYITDQTIANANAIERLGGDASNDGRINNSSMDTMTSQINELYQRQSGLVTSPDVSTPSFSSGTRTVNVTLQLPRPTDAARIGWLSAQATAVNSNSNASQAAASFSIDGVLFHRDSRIVPSSQFDPPSWNGIKAITGYSGFTASPSSGGTVTMQLQASPDIFSSGARTVTFRNIQVTYQYGQKV